MASLMHRIQMFLRSPQGRQFIARGQREMAKPANRQRLQRIVGRLRGRR
ncbi:hypothetical protein [Plantactinospora sonchi]|uniref:Uncharacterized protein n=1 Tax=Plantactinospora sonchi TaxID=1544735 RepID=A0ABU7RRJ2_9ACTN